MPDDVVVAGGHNELDCRRIQIASQRISLLPAATVTFIIGCIIYKCKKQILFRGLFFFARMLISPKRIHRRHTT